eukprot:XP_027317288.1 interleukin-15 receptor subunit alpha isoform X5 [Anas platyrhynchos]
MARPLLSLLCGAVALLLPWIAGETVRCSRPKAVDNAHIDAGNSTQLHACLRYTCKPGYKRKAGTSGLIQCVLHDSKPVWTPASLQCIRDPALPLQTPSPELPPVLPTMRTSQRVSAQILASSIGLPLLVIAGVVACCCWRMKIHPQAIDRSEELQHQHQHHPAAAQGPSDTAPGSFGGIFGTDPRCPPAPAARRGAQAGAVHYRHCQNPKATTRRPRENSPFAFYKNV